MSGSNLSKAILSDPLTSPSEDKQESVSVILRLTKYFELVRTNAAQSIDEMHQNRLKALRREVDHLRETEWKYDPIEKYIGH